MRWQHDNLRGCALDVGSGRGVIHIDAEGFVDESRLNAFAKSALDQWADAIGFTARASEPPKPPKKSRRRKKED
jgi:hypothetical protein